MRIESRASIGCFFTAIIFRSTPTQTSANEEEQQQRRQQQSKKRYIKVSTKTKNVLSLSLSLLSLDSNESLNKQETINNRTTRLYLTIATSSEISAIGQYRYIVREKNKDNPKSVPSKDLLTNVSRILLRTKRNESHALAKETNKSHTNSRVTCPPCCCGIEEVIVRTFRARRFLSSNLPVP